MTETKASNSIWNLRFHQFALWVAAIGAATGIIASFAAWGLRGQFAETTFWASIFAVMAALPVWQSYRNMRSSANEES